MRVYFVSGVAAFLKEFLCPDVERFCLRPIEKPSEAIGFAEKNLRVIGRLRVVE